MGETICKIYEELIQLNSKTTTTNKKPILKLGKGPELTFFQRRHSNDQQIHEKVLKVTNH